MVETHEQGVAATSLLATKRYVPRRRAKLVSRPRLTARLDQGLGCTLTLVAAPAGSGKTTLLADWLAATRADQRATVWVSLDPGDNDPARFWTYVITALQAAGPGIGQAALALLTAPQPPPTETILTTLINDLAAAASGAVLVLDDYHVIHSRPIHEALAFLLDNLPPQLHLIIATREDPPLPLPRLRARGHLTEIRAADLRFTPAEAADFLNTVMGLALPAGDVAALESRTEGWIAGLQLAALSVQGRGDVSGFIRAFAGDNRYIVDYLVAEVLQRQPDTLRRFLLDTAILDRLSGPLCDAVTGRDDGAETLELLERGNLFVVPLDDTRRWYRYHHLFAEVLRVRLLTEYPGQTAGLHRKASAWYEREGVMVDAIRHALASGDVTRAADLVELAAPAMRRSRREATLLSWCRALPDDLVRCRPVLSVGYASALLSTGELEGVDDRLRDAERWLAQALPGADAPEGLPTEMVVVNHEEYRRLPGMIAVFRAGKALALGDLATTVVQARTALNLLDARDLVWCGAASALLGLASWASGDLAAAYESYATGMARLQQAGNIADAIAGAITLADLRIAQGRLRDASQLYERALQLAADEGEPTLRGTADMHVGLSAIDREHGDLEAATRRLRVSKELGDQAGFPQNPYRWCVAMARVREAQSDLEGALEQLHEAERRYAGDFSPNVRPVAAMLARLWIAQGRLSDAWGWAEAQGLSVDDDPEYLREFAHLTLARLLLARSAHDADERALDQTLGLLERLLQAAEAGERWGSVIDILVVQALARQRRGDLPAALSSLERAL
ncbi:MAG: AAA family ATPase, partial [Thermomicrobiales bacterium]|nr:AAA family ATPase [Thermomicrobiales bacterium]